MFSWIKIKQNYWKKTFKYQCLHVIPYTLQFANILKKLSNNKFYC